MDEIDIQIIKLLEEDGRITHEEISKLLHISRPSVHQRVTKMEKNNVIKGYRSVINWNKLDEKIQAIIFVKIKCQNFKEVVANIITLDVKKVKILEAQRLAGEWCLMLKIRVSDPQNITNLIDEMVKIPEVQETSTTFILTTILENGLKEKEYDKRKDVIKHETAEE